MLPHVTDMAVEIIGVRFGMETRPDLYHMTPAGRHVSCTGSPLSLVGFTQGHFSKGHSNFLYNLPFIYKPDSVQISQICNTDFFTSASIFVWVIQI